MHLGASLRITQTIQSASPGGSGKLYCEKFQIKQKQRFEKLLFSIVKEQKFWKIS